MFGAAEKSAAVELAPVVQRDKKRVDVRGDFVQVQRGGNNPAAIPLLEPLRCGLGPGLQTFGIIGSGFFRRARPKVVRAGGKQHFYAKHSIGADALIADGLLDRVNAVLVRGADEHGILRGTGSVSVGRIPFPLVVLAGTGDGSPGFELLNAEYGKGHGYILPSALSGSISALAQRTPPRFPWRVTRRNSFPSYSP